MPIFVKMGASRVFDDVRLAAKAGADVIVVDGMEGGTGASPELLQEHTGIPTLAAVCEARAALEDIGLYGKVQLVIAGGLRHGSDCAKAMALGADACYLGTALLIALNCNKPIYVEDYHKIGAAPYSCHHCHTGRCPVGITTQDPELTARLDVDAGRRAGRQLLPRPDLRDPDPGPRLRQERRSPPRARRPARPDPRSLADHRPAPGRHQPRLRRRAGLESHVPRPALTRASGGREHRHRRIEPPESPLWLREKLDTDGLIDFHELAGHFPVSISPLDDSDSATPLAGYEDPLPGGIDAETTGSLDQPIPCTRDEPGASRLVGIHLEHGETVVAPIRYEDVTLIRVNEHLSGRVSAWTRDSGQNLVAPLGQPVGAVVSLQ